MPMQSKAGEGYIQQRGERGGEKRSGLGFSASFNYQHQNSSFEEGLSYRLTVVYGVTGFGNRAAVSSVFRRLFSLFRQVLVCLRYRLTRYY